MKAVDGKGQARLLLVQLKILPLGESVPKDLCCWLLKREHIPAPLVEPVQGRFADWKTEKAYVPASQV